MACQSSSTCPSHLVAAARPRKNPNGLAGIRRQRVPNGRRLPVVPSSRQTIGSFTPTYPIQRMPRYGACFALAEGVVLCRLASGRPAIPRSTRDRRHFVSASCASDARWSNQWTRAHTRTARQSMPRKGAHFVWRKGWDSNPRETCASAGFQDRCIRPLCHPSTTRQLNRPGLVLAYSFVVINLSPE
jgi:hypothetical protein